MTRVINNRSTRHLPGKLAAGLVISACFVLGTFLASANAEEHHGGEHHGGEHYGGGHHGGWHGDYYPAPPVVYGSPYYYPPPVVYGPGIGIALPGLSIGIR
jgi:hypothetical protein